MCIGWVDSPVVGHGQGFVFCQIIVLLAALKGRTARHKSQGALGCCYMRGAWVQVLQFGTLQGSSTISPQMGGTRKIIDSNTCWRLWGIWTVSSLEGMYFLANLLRNCSFQMSKCPQDFKLSGISCHLFRRLFWTWSSRRGLSTPTIIGWFGLKHIHGAPSKSQVQFSEGDFTT